MMEDILAYMHNFPAAGAKGPFTGLSAAWSCPSNIALVKYWGKRDGQLPVNPSLSMTLTQAVTRTRLTVAAETCEPGLASVNGDPGHPFLGKLRVLHRWFCETIPALRPLALTVETRNTFPHSSGIASSASGLGAFALCMLDLAGLLTKAGTAQDEFMRAASMAARIGSGSACRSLFGGFAWWGESPLMGESSDQYAVKIRNGIHPEMYGLRDAILVISSRPKELPSSAGHRAMDRHPFREGRISHAGENLRELLDALASGDFGKLADIAENEALTLHSLMMSARPGVILLQPGTLEAIARVREARRAGVPVCFTIDAGANLHLLYPATASADVERLISEALRPLCENELVIYDSCGTGPVRLAETQPLA